MQTIKFPIVKPFLPSIERYKSRIEGVFERNWLTNSGPLLNELEQALADYLGVKHLMLVSNGTVALQVAYSALGVSGKVLTTPFSFAATASSLCWQGITPEFVDIDQENFNLDVSTLSNEQLETASAILPVHVFGNPCKVEEIDHCAKKHGLKVIYDAAHCFASQYKGESVLNYGDAATLSLHATKLFHSVEGGAVIFKHEEDLIRARKLINFGFDAQQYPELIGINGKMSEFHAAMGLANLEEIERVSAHRRALVARYKKQIGNAIQFQCWNQHGENNGAYMPVLFKTESELLRASNHLSLCGIQTRRYFYPSLSEVPVYGQRGETPIANAISRRILCLPLYATLDFDGVDYISRQLKQSVSN